MAGCYGSSAEDRYYEAMLDRYLDESYGPDLEKYEEEAAVEINSEIDEDEDVFYDWLTEQFDFKWYEAEYHIDEETLYQRLKKLSCVRDSYIGYRMDSVCERLYDDENDAREAAYDDWCDRQYEEMREREYEDDH